LLVFAWRGGTVQEKKLGAEQAHAFRAGIERKLDLGDVADVGKNLDGMTVAGLGGKMTRAAFLIRALAVFELTRLESGREIGGGIEPDFAGRSVEGQG
jgi:hypothetical protein